MVVILGRFFEGRNAKKSIWKKEHLRKEASGKRSIYEKKHLEKSICEKKYLKKKEKMKDGKSLFFCRL